MTLRGMACCGIRELEGLEDFSEPKEAMKEFYQEAFQSRQRFDHAQMRYVRSKRRVNFSHVIFSEADNRWPREAYGQKFAAFIKRNGLGDVAASQRRVNPNSSNQLKVWVWTLNKQAIKAWGEKHA